MALQAVFLQILRICCKLASKNNNNNKSSKNKGVRKQGAGNRNQRKEKLAVSVNLTKPRQENRQPKPSSRAMKIVSFDNVLCTVKSGINYGAASYTTNPGLSSSFPWLNIEAGQWERYKFLELEFHYESTIGVTNANSVGYVGMMFDPDPTDPNPPNAEIFRNNQIADAKRPDKSWSLKVPKDVLSKNGTALLVRDSQKPDVKFYDVGKFVLFADGQVADGVNLGSIKVKGRVQFIDRNMPYFGSQLTPNNLYSVFARSTTAKQNIPDGVITTVDWAVNSVDGLGLWPLSSGVMTLPRGIFLITTTGFVTASSAGADLAVVNSFFECSDVLPPGTNEPSQYKTTAGSCYQFPVNNTIIVNVTKDATFAFKLFVDNAGTNADYAGSIYITMLR